MDIMRIQKDSTLSQLINGGILLIEPIRLSVKDDGQFILYQTLGISLVHKSKHQNNKKKYFENVDKKNLDESIPTHQRVTKKRTKRYFDLFVPETLLSTRRRRKLRILICLNSRNKLPRKKQEFKSVMRIRREFLTNNKRRGKACLL